MNKKITFAIVSFTVLLLVPGVYFYSKYKTVQNELSRVALPSKEENTKLFEKVSKIMELPKDDELSVATITDKNKLAGQSFFARAENGDKVLIFTKAQKAILYRPGTNKIVEASGIDQQIVANSSESAKIVDPNSFLPIAVYNGTARVGLTRKYEADLEGKVEVRVVAKENAVKKDYQQSVVVDVTGKSALMAKQLADGLGTVVVNVVPEGEATPSASILVILGEDYK